MGSRQSQPGSQVGMAGSHLSWWDPAVPTRDPMWDPAQHAGLTHPTQDPDWDSAIPPGIILPTQDLRRE